VCVCVCVCVWGRRTLNCTPTGCAWQLLLLLQQSMCVQCLLLLLQSCESQLLLLLLLLSLCLCLCLSHRRNDTSHAAALVSVDVDSSCDERRDIHRQTDTVVAVAYRLLYSIAKLAGRMYVPTMEEKRKLD
jgi:hypothetical protein